MRESPTTMMLSGRGREARGGDRPLTVDLAVRRRQMGGAERLMLAVLQDAIDCLIAHVDARRPKYQRLFSEAHAWVLDDSTGELYAFRTICDVLGLDAEAIRDATSRFLAGLAPLPARPPAPSGRARAAAGAPARSGASADRRRLVGNLTGSGVTGSRAA
jgi:hypothetical protein